MGTKGPKAGNIFTSLRSRGLVGGQGQDPSIKGMGSPLKQTNGDGRDGSAYGALKRFGKSVIKTGVEVQKHNANTVKDMFNSTVISKLTTGFGHGNRHMDGPPPKTEQSKNSKAVLESEKKGDEAINDKMKATPLKEIDKRGTRIINQGEKAEAAYKAGNDKKGDRHKNRAKRIKKRDDAKKLKDNLKNSPAKKKNHKY